MGSRQNDELGPARMRLSAAAVAFMVPLAVYVLTLARSVTFVDSGELTAVAATLGIAHPPGYPLFTLLGHLFSLAPVGTVVLRVGLLSALSAAAASSLVYWAGSGLALRFWRRPLGPARRTDTALVWAPLAGALLFSFSRTVWSQAVVVEIYCLQTFLVMLLVAICTLALSRPASALAYWPSIAFAFGLALTNHLTGVLMAPALLLFVLSALTARARQTERAPVTLWRGLGAGALPLLLYLYLPLRARTEPLVAWDYTETLQRFLVHVTARQYHAALGRQGLRIEELGRFVTRQLPGEASWLLVVLGAVGLVALLRRDWRVGSLTLVSAAVIVLYNMAYPIHDIDVYYMPVLALVGLWAAVGAAFLAGLVSRWHGTAGVTAGGLLCLACVLPLTGNWRANDQSGFKLLEYYVRDTLTHLDQDAVVFSGHWDRFSSPSIYVQQVEGYRTDVLVIDMGTLGSPSLGRRLDSGRHDLAAACREELLAMAEIAHLAELGRPYDVAEGRARYQRLQRALLESSLELYPTYVTSDIGNHPMLQGYSLIAEGLVGRVAREDEYRPFPVPDFMGPGMRRAEARDARELEIVFEYGRMLRNRAIYLERHGRTEEAELIARLADEASR